MYSGRDQWSSTAISRERVGLEEPAPNATARVQESKEEGKNEDG
jgi:hypothetical protein